MRDGGISAAFGALRGNFLGFVVMLACLLQTKAED